MCLYALKIDSEYFKALILLNECLNFDRLLINDFDKDYTEFVSIKFGGKLNMDDMLQDSRFENYKSNLLKKLTKFQEELFKPCHEDDWPVKRKEFVLQSKKCVNFKEIAKIILNFYYTIQQEGYGIGSKIVFEDDQPKINCTPVEGDSANKQSQEISSQVSEDQDSIDREQSKTDNSDFNFADFVDKRRSTRNKKVPKANEDVDEKKSELEKLLDLFPGTLKKFSSSPLLSKENSQFSNISQDNKDEKSALTKQFLEDLREEFQLRNNKMNIYQLIRFFLIKLSIYKNFTIPEEFYVLYKIYR